MAYITVQDADNQPSHYYPDAEFSIAFTFPTITIRAKRNQSYVEIAITTEELIHVLGKHGLKLSTL